MTIKDELLNPFQIHSNEAGGYMLKEFDKMIIDKDTNKEKESFKRTYHISSIQKCITKVIELRLKDEKEIINLSEYMTKLTRKTKELDLLLVSF